MRWSKVIKLYLKLSGCIFRPHNVSEHSGFLSHTAVLVVKVIVVMVTDSTPDPFPLLLSSRREKEDGLK